MAKLSPMMQQYFEIKEKYKDTILFFRLGDFYEMFYDDAITCSKELELTLTGKDCGQEERAPMCGVPFHSADQYVDKLIEKGYKVAICEQVEDPAQAKGIVKRDVVRVVTAGTVTDSKILDDKNNNYLCTVVLKNDTAGMSFVDVTTGDLFATEMPFDKGAMLSELARYNPSEIICNREFLANEKLLSFIQERFSCSAEAEDDYFFEEDFVHNKIMEQFGKDVESLPVNGYICATASVGAMLEYLSKTQMCRLPHIHEINFYTTEQYMDVDFSSKRNLEITSTMRDNKRRGSLLWVLDDTETSMGARLLKSWIDKPLLNAVSIQNRLNAVDELCKSTIIRSEIRESLSGIQDIERLVSRVVTGSANCRDLLAIQASFKPIPDIISNATRLTSSLNCSVASQLDDLQDICDLLERSIIDNPPLTIKEGGIIREGFNADVDNYRKAMTEGKQWLATIEQQEKEKTGIKNLKIGFNRVFGYYIEVSKSNLGLVPDTYIRKQTLTTGERYITGELKEIENSILGAEERICALEYAIFCEIREQVANANMRILQTAKALAELDVLCSLAEVAVKNNYCKPVINVSDKIDIKDGRHPVVERVLKGQQLFIPNDTYLSKSDRVSIITGPNMAGKSTYMRQVALIVLMAQMGSFVPASSAEIGIVDKIFTRVGASDDLASGQSTFMVEMNEVANILDNATKNSLLILDEIGRGTSTYDGLSIAWAVVEYIADLKKLGAKTLFATHYHELTELEDKLDGVKNYCIAVKKRGDDIIFLRKIIQGGADESYGIEVAKLAGVKNDVIKRAKEIVDKLAVINTDINIPVELPADDDVQLGFEQIGGNKIIEKLQKMDVTTLTPIEAMNILYELKTEADKL